MGYYYTKDHLGSVREMTSTTGTTTTIAARYDYDPFGRATPTGTVTVASDFQYAGMYAHAASGLNFTLARVFDPTTTRWLSRDPMGEGVGTNLYAYCNNDPVNGTDPLGMMSQTPVYLRYPNTPLNSIGQPIASGWYEFAGAGSGLGWVHLSSNGPGAVPSTTAVSNNGSPSTRASAAVSTSGPQSTKNPFNPLLYTVGAINYGRGSLKILAARAFFGAGIVALDFPPTAWADPILLGAGAWNTAGGLALIQRGSNEMLQAPNTTPGPEWQNLLGLAPFGGNFDTSAKASTSVSNIENSSFGTWVSEIASGF